MIVLLSCSINSLGNSNVDVHPSTGVVNPKDSVLISYDDLRIANSKMIELEYEKEKNVLLKTALSVDSILMENQNQVIKETQEHRDKAIKQRDIATISTGASLLVLLMTLLLK